MEEKIVAHDYLHIYLLMRIYLPNYDYLFIYLLTIINLPCNTFIHIHIAFFQVFLYALPSYILPPPPNFTSKGTHAPSLHFQVCLAFSSMSSLKFIITFFLCFFKPLCKTLEQPKASSLAYLV